MYFELECSQPACEKFSARNFRDLCSFQSEVLIKMREKFCAASSNLSFPPANQPAADAINQKLQIYLKRKTSQRTLTVKFICIVLHCIRLKIVQKLIFIQKASSRVRIVVNRIMAYGWRDWKELIKVQSSVNKIQ